MARDYYQTSFGSIRLWCSEIETDNSRTIVVHELAQGDDHPLSDRGLAPRTTKVSLLFDDFPDEPDSALDRFLRFKKTVDDGIEDMFIHPIDGAYAAKVGAFTYKIDEDGNITDVSCEFRPNQVVAAILQPGAGRAGIIGIDSVQARADELNALLESVDISSELGDVDLPEDFVSAAALLPDVWAADDAITTRQILVDVARVSDQIATLLTLLEDDLALFETYKATIMFGAAFSAAAQAATSETSAVFVLRVVIPTSVLGLVVRVYGGTDAELRERQVRSLNDLRTFGGMLQSGTDMVMPKTSNREVL
jgi:hypothetical protein